MLFLLCIEKLGLRLNLKLGEHLEAFGRLLFTRILSQEIRAHTNNFPIHIFLKILTHFHIIWFLGVAPDFCLKIGETVVNAVWWLILLKFTTTPNVIDGVKKAHFDVLVAKLARRLCDRQLKRALFQNHRTTISLSTLIFLGPQLVE